MDIAVENSDFKNHSRADHIGIWASILCAIHCTLTPVLLIALPTFGKAWAHPATHWGMALIVIPIAAFMIRKGYKKHTRKWIVVTGCVGIVLIIIGAILPYMEPAEFSSKSADAESAVKLPSTSQSAVPEEASSFG